jgi:excisionase family DNA binding protein
MDDLLTTKQLQELLQVDRITVYRMLKDGRLTGVKVGNQWRFPRAEVEEFLSGAPPIDTPSKPESDGSNAMSTEVVPLNCIQTVQDVFAEMSGIGAVTTGADGLPLTQLSNCSKFCRLIQSSPSGYQACITSWRQLVTQPETIPQFISCHAGLQYARGRIEINNKLVGLLIAGQFYADETEVEAIDSQIEQLATKHNLDADHLRKSASNLPTLNDHQRAWIGVWLEKIAHTFEQVGAERFELMSRLRHIAEMSTLPPSP